MIRAALLQPSRAFAPEVLALREYLSAQEGISPFVVSESEVTNAQDADVLYRMMGFSPRWAQTHVPEIHDYASLSTGSLPTLKNWAKRFGSRRPIFRTFLNDYVRRGMGFQDRVPWAHRDMGVPQAFIDARRHEFGTRRDREFDLVYVGTLSAHRGVGAMAAGVLGAGLKLLLVGDPDNDLFRAFRGRTGLEICGRVNHADIPTVCDRAWAGISHVPPSVPFGNQTATKILEYCALGLPVVTNETNWAATYERRSGARFLALSDWSHLRPEQLAAREFALPRVPPATWPEIFDSSGIADVIRKAPL